MKEFKYLRTSSLMPYLVPVVDPMSVTAAATPTYRTACIRPMHKAHAILDYDYDTILIPDDEGTMPHARSQYDYKLLIWSSISGLQQIQNGMEMKYDEWGARRTRAEREPKRICIACIRIWPSSSLSTTLTTRPRGSRGIVSPACSSCHSTRLLLALRHDSVTLSFVVSQLKIQK